MKLEDAKEALRQFILKPFGRIFKPDELADLKRDKGIVGKLLERALGLNPSSLTLDFEDGELKTNRCYCDGRPRETMWITQISEAIDSILNKQPFEQSILWKKTQRFLYVPVCKDGDTSEWKFLPFIDVDLRTRRLASVRKQISEDYYAIADQLRQHIERSDNGYIHTSSGKFVQVRTKDAKPYHPIYSRKYGRKVSDKNYAFYFRKEFMIHLQTLAPDYPLDCIKSHGTKVP
jgi:DNA mismatch repair protein MutH